MIAAANDNSARRGDWMQTFTGRQFWPMDPSPAEVDIRDIAHALSMICRYGGHCERFYSVAEHSVLGALTIADEALRLPFLLHDAPEAYLVDVPRPVKPYLDGYGEAEQRVWLAIAGCFGLPPELPDGVKHADNAILLDEMQQNMKAPPAPWRIGTEPLGVRLRYWKPEEAEAIFLNTFHLLWGRRAAHAA
jgi:uncharacterized protein